VLPAPVCVVHHGEDASGDVLDHLGQPHLEIQPLELLHGLNRGNHLRRERVEKEVKTERENQNESPRQGSFSGSDPIQFARAAFLAGMRTRPARVHNFSLLFWASPRA
jgi:hypothetical protein